MDFSDIAKLVGMVEKIESVLKVYDKNKALFDKIFGLIITLFDRKPVTPPTVPTGAPVEPVNPASGQVYYKLVAKCFFLEGDRHGTGRGEIYPKNIFDQVLSKDGPAAQMVNDRMHLDITPLDVNGREIGPDDPRHPIVNNDVPLRYVWTYAGKVLTDTEDRRFNLESVKDDHGCTPVLRLDEGESGRHEVTFQARILPEFNGGVEVKSNVVTWYAD